MDENNNLKVLVIGCGGLGSEVIKLLNNLKYNITVIDYDGVELSNLNRQFFFTKNDKNKFKSEVIGKKIHCKYLVEKLEKLENTFLDEFDVVFSCLDNIQSRMQLNYVFFQSKCSKLVDCGVEGFKAHVKRVNKNESCLYCIRDLYNTTKSPYICTLKNIGNQVISEENRNLILNSIVFEAKEAAFENNQSEQGIDQIINDIVLAFNSTVSEKLKTSYFEIYGIYNEIIANVCTINSICASLSLILAFDDSSNNFIFFDGTCKPLTTKLNIEKDPRCFICNQK